MRKANVRAIQDTQKSVLLSLNRFLYLLKPVTANTGDSLRAGAESCGYKILSKIECEAT